MIVFCCPKCKMVDIGDENEQKSCMRCAFPMLSLGVTSMEWNKYSNDQMKNVINTRIEEYESENMVKQPVWDDEPNPKSQEHQVEVSEKVIPPVARQETEVIREEMVKCPNCGASIGRIDAVCRFCGAQITNREAANSVRKFAEELARIEEEASENTGAKGLMGNYMKAFGLDKAMEKGYGSKTFERKISLIKSFPIPNTVEEISEFVVMAASSINVEYGKKSKKNAFRGTPGNTFYTEITLANAWVSKLEQAYNKAELSFADDPVFQKIKRIYEDKMRELDRL